MSSELQRIQHRLLASLQQVGAVGPELEQQASRLRRLAATTHHLLHGSSGPNAQALDAILREAVAKCIGASRQLAAAKTAGERWASRAQWLTKAAAASAGGAAAGTLARVDALEQAVAQAVQIFEQQQTRLERSSAPGEATASLNKFVWMNLEISKTAQQSTTAGYARITTPNASPDSPGGDSTGMLAVVMLIVLWKKIFPRKK